MSAATRTDTVTRGEVDEGPQDERVGVSTRVFASEGARGRALSVLVVAVGAFLLLGVLVRRYAPWFFDPVAARAWIRTFGSLAPLAFVLLQAAQVVVAPVPGQVLGVASGYLFGALWGTVYSVAGTAVGSLVAFWLSRRFGRPFVERVLDPEALELFDDFSHEHGIGALFLVFLVPGLPDDAVCFVAGLTEFRLRTLVVVAAVGRFPGFLLANLVGAELAAAQYVEAAILVLALVVASVVGYLARDDVASFAGLR
jgi:uncharacterized membrane protein YdjX (TVP38/TMEM64 family)